MEAKVIARLLLGVRKALSSASQPRSLTRLVNNMIFFFFFFSPNNFHLLNTITKKKKEITGCDNFLRSFFFIKSKKKYNKVLINTLTVIDFIFLPWITITIKGQSARLPTRKNKKKVCLFFFFFPIIVFLFSYPL